eukprot:131410-Prymnesium_polylepis.2
MPEKVEKLVKMQIEKYKGSAIFLWAVDAAMTAAQSQGSKLIQEYGLQSSTVGVYTKCDNLGMKPLTLNPFRAAGDYKTSARA